MIDCVYFIAGQWSAIDPPKKRTPSKNESPISQPKAPQKREMAMQ